MGGKGNKKGNKSWKIGRHDDNCQALRQVVDSEFSFEKVWTIMLGGCGRESSKVERKIVGTRFVCDGNCECERFVADAIGFSFRAGFTKNYERLCLE